MLPIAAGTALSYVRGWPASWRAADWSSSGLLPSATADPQAVIYIMAARSGRWKGIFAVHHWIVLKPPGAKSYERFDVVGWGHPVRRNNYPADGLWYSSPPRIVHQVRGQAAARLIPQVRRAVAGYPWSHRGDYRIWPGPNSNTFVAYVARQVPELGAQLDVTGIGKDWLGPGLHTSTMPSGEGWQVSWSGLVGLGYSAADGIELHLLGATIGIDFDDLAIKLPALGRIGLK